MEDPGKQVCGDAPVEVSRSVQVDSLLLSCWMVGNGSSCGAAFFHHDVCVSLIAANISPKQGWMTEF